MLNKKAIAVLIVLLFVGSLIIIKGRFGDKHITVLASSLEKEKIVFGLVKWPGYLGLYAAREFGFFDQEGLLIDWRDYNPLQELSKDYVNGDIDGRANLVSDAISETYQGIDHKIIFIFTSAKDIENEIGVATFKSDFIKNNPQKILAFSKAYFKGVDFIKNHPEEAKEMLAGLFSISPDDAREQLKDIYIPDLKENRTAFTFAPGSQSIYSNLRKTGRFFESYYKKDNILDTDELIDSKFIVNLFKIIYETID
ncbi:hypothetical protein A2645_01310 [Candidatus Nomurabacteria bacterium RIFCSPHIGHO2_01_FULL_39_9]|uniref:SsuA/THI5-like domain-containing protein n=1 Tax=Candidatus Nomurabacteria bacterium RIFCSPHIGHO2_01_FULL_39_9 TaxID=1801735 RepID=A0A1F6UXT3_9BACT|nr:MAG: hypothetical protein A2645_01310 [Candidatus Nomurabacteria bacterium RIFCSPHIGHO2_01_FULL_39_9]